MLTKFRPRLPHFKRPPLTRVISAMTLECRRHLLALVLGALAAVASAQEVLLPRAYETANVGIVYDREVAFPLTIHTNGFHVGVNVGQLKTYYKTTYWGGTVGLLQHPRELKQSDGSGGLRRGSSGFVYGKQRTMIPVRVYKGWKRYYSGKDRRRGVAVGTAFEVGATAGLAKAYQLQVGCVDCGPLSTAPRFISYDDDPAAFLNRDIIEGAGGLRRGWSDLKIYPGVNAKAAIHLDWGAYDEFMRGLEAGIMVDAFAGSVDLLTPPANNTPLFVNFYLALHLGRRK